MSLPGPLADLDLGEPALGHLRTAGQVPFLDPATGEQKPASIWFVVCRTRCWLVAATLTDQWSVGDTDVALDKGWTWDAIRVGAWSSPLRNGTRGQAAALIAQWREAEGGGRPVPAPAAAHPETRAKRAAGANNVPDWIEARVPADPEGRWLFAFETDHELSFLTHSGQLERRPVWVAISDREVVLAAEGPIEPFVKVVEGAVEVRTRTTARDLLVADGWQLPGALVDRKIPLAHALAAAEGDARWAVAVEQAIEAGDGARTAALLREAFVLGRHGACWPWVGLLALESDPVAATGAALHHMADAPALALRDAALVWAHHRGAVRTLDAPLPKGLLAECRVPELPDGLPWPPTGPIEVYAVAGLLLDRAAEALELWASRGDSPRVRQAIAAQAAHAAEEDAWESWLVAAERWRGEDDPAALEALDRAVALAPDPVSLRWRAGVWRYQDGADPSADWAAALPTPPPATLEASPDTWRAIATQAAAAEAWEAAERAWREVQEAEPRDRASLVERARILETRLDRVADAVTVLRELAVRTESVVEPEPARWWVWTEIGRLVMALDAAEGRTGAVDGPEPPPAPEAMAALSEAIRGDFLVPDAYARALELGEGVAPPATLDWWRHLRRVLTGHDEGRPRPPVQHLEGDALDALHPGGIGWLERARQSLDTSEPPPIAELTRGLERVQPARWPRVSAALSSLSEALGIEPPAAYLFRGEGAWGLSAWPTEPPLLLVGHDHLDEDHPLSLRREALTFALAVELVHLAARHPLLAFDGGLVGTSRSVYQAFGKYAGTAETVVDMVTLLPGVDQIAKIQTVIKLSKRVFTARSVVDKTTGFAESGMSWLGWNSEQQKTVGRSFEGPALQFRLQADRAALMLTGDLEAALEAILKGNPTTAKTWEKARADGLLAVIRELDEDTAMRVGSLVGFAATL